MMDKEKALTDFYDSEQGRIFGWFLRQEIKKIWHLDSGESIIGFGKTAQLRLPNSISLSNFCSKSAAQIMPHKLPLRNSETKRICALHYLENIDLPLNAIEEFARILEPAGSLIIIIPNKLSLWKQTPIQGQYELSADMLIKYLVANKFAIQQVKQAVFYPPQITSQLAKAFSIFPFFGAVTIIHARKIIFPNRGRPIKLAQTIREWVATKKKGLVSFPAAQKNIPEDSK